VLRARNVLRAHDCPGALAALDEARTRFPTGTLAQEREALTVEALACSGRGAEAGRRAVEFLRTFPASPYEEAVRRFAHVTAATSR
jgi:hypothetical protein